MTKSIQEINEILGCAVDVDDQPGIRGALKVKLLTSEA